MPTTSSNQLSFSTLAAAYGATLIASGAGANIDTSVVAGPANGCVVLDVLFRNFNTTTAVNFEIIICTTGSSGTALFNRTQIVVPANAGNNGVVPLASLAALAPLLFDLDLAGNRVMTLENTVNIYVRNKAALTADVIITVKQRNF